MFDNLRDTSFYEDEQGDPYQESAVQPTVAATRKRRRRTSRFLGMTAQQRFFLAFMLLLVVCVLGLLAMIVTERMCLF